MEVGLDNRSVLFAATATAGRGDDGVFGVPCYAFKIGFTTTTTGNT